MSVIIEGMEMPCGCKTCQLRDLCFDYYVCRAKKLERGGYLDVDDEAIAGRRHRCCPLVEIPTPHGRLIDADKLLESFGKAIEEDNHFVNFFSLVDEAPTIIEAEVE